MIKLKNLIKEIFTFPPDAKFGLGVIDSYDAIHFKEVPRDLFSSYTHESLKLHGRYRFRYANGNIDWTDSPSVEQEAAVDNYLTSKGYKIKEHFYPYDDND